MRILTICAVPLFVLHASLLWAAPAPKTPATKVEIYAVVQIVPGEEVRVIKATELPALKKTLKEDYNRDMKAWEEAKKDASKSKDKDKDKGKEVAEPTKPVKKKIKVLKATCRSEKDAQAWKEKYLEDKKEKESDDSKTAKKPMW